MHYFRQLSFPFFLLADKLFAKNFAKLWNVSVNNNLCGKLVSSLESTITFDERFNVTSVQFLILDFNI